MSNRFNHNICAIKEYIKIGWKYTKSFIKGVVLPVSLSGKKPIIFGDKPLDIPSWCIFELKLMVDFLFYGYVLFALSSHFIDPVYVWFYFGDYVFGVFYFIFLSCLFNFCFSKWKKRKI